MAGFVLVGFRPHNARPLGPPTEVGGSESQV